MRIARGLMLTLLLLPFGGLLAGCESLENFQIWDTKKKLPGVREPVFPAGVPGVQQGIPPELVKGYKEPEGTVANPAAVAAQESAEKIEPKAETKQPPKPHKVAKPKAHPVQQQAQPQQAQQTWPAQQQAQPPAQQTGTPWPQQQQQQQQPTQQAQAPWPGTQSQSQGQTSPWPTR